jgi:putative NADH-flavin reductase
MKMLILGATGPTGRQVVDFALKAGDTVTVLVRQPAAMVDLPDKVKVRVGDATSRTDLAQAMAGHDVVVSAVGRRTSMRADGLFTRAAAAVVDAAKQAGVSKLVWLSSFGVGATFKSASPLQKFIYSTMLRNLYADKELSERGIRSSTLDWTLVYPTMLTHGEAKGAYVSGDRLPMKGNPSISRADVAHFLHHAAHTDEWVRRDAVITDK